MAEKINHENFDEEEDRIYKKNLEAIRSGIRAGLKFDLACGFVAVEDRELKDLIIDDALKVEIAELHYGKGLSFHDISKTLGVPMERLLKANAEMMEDVVNDAVESERKQKSKDGPTTH